jgi:heme/copper-type cytochrome/quinol oxidase subunit 2
MVQKNSLSQSLVLNLFRNTLSAVFIFFILITFIFNSDRDFFTNAFKDPASPVMEGIIDFHHDVFFFLIVILVFVGWFLIRILAYNIVSDNIVITSVTLLSKPVQIQSLEFIWTLVPTIILFAIAGPSFTLLYAMNELLTPSITIKAIGNQWFWTYEIADPVVFSVKDLIEDKPRTPQEFLQDVLFHGSRFPLQPNEIDLWIPKSRLTILFDLYKQHPDFFLKMMKNYLDPLSNVPHEERAKLYHTFFKDLFSVESLLQSKSQPARVEEVTNRLLTKCPLHLSKEDMDILINHLENQLDEKQMKKIKDLEDLWQTLKDFDENEKKK